MKERESHAALIRHIAASRRLLLLRGITGSPGCISHASYSLSRHTCHAFETLSRVYTPLRSCISNELSIFDFRGWTLSWTTSYLSHMQANGVQWAPSHPSLSKRRRCKSSKRNRRGVRKNAHEVLTKSGREKESISMHLSLCHHDITTYTIIRNRSGRLVLDFLRDISSKIFF